VLIVQSIVTRGSLTSIGIAALVGAGLGAAGLLVLPSASPTARDAEGAELLRAAAAKGLPDGRIRIVEPHWTRERQVARDPRQPGLVQIRLLERPYGLDVLKAGQQDLLRHLFGDVEQFLRIYRVTAGPVSEGQGDDRQVSVEWRKDGLDDAVSRRAWFSASGELIRLVERDGRGGVLRSVELVKRDLDGWKPVGSTKAEADWARVERLDFPDFAETLGFPLYEPSELPPRFRRTDWGADRRAFRGGTSASSLAWIAYTDGMLRMNLFVATPDRMKQLEEIARQQNTAAGPSGCPTSGADTPEELVEAGAIPVYRRDDGCRIVLRRDDLKGVAVVLVGYRGLTVSDYMRTMRSLVPVASGAPLKPGEKAVGGDESR
jgi:hypothetical protein